MAEPNPDRRVGPDGGYFHRLLLARRISFAPKGLAGVRDCAAIRVPLLLSDSRPRQPARWCHSSGSSEFDDPWAVPVRTVNARRNSPDVLTYSERIRESELHLIRVQP